MKIFIPLSSESISWYTEIVNKFCLTSGISYLVQLTQITDILECMNFRDTLKTVKRISNVGFAICHHPANIRVNPDICLDECGNLIATFNTPLINTRGLPQSTNLDMDTLVTENSRVREENKRYEQMIAAFTKQLVQKDKEYFNLNKTHNTLVKSHNIVVLTNVTLARQNHELANTLYPNVAAVNDSNIINHNDLDTSPKI